jgi:hypothetical protein
LLGLIVSADKHCSTIDNPGYTKSGYQRLLTLNPSSTNDNG